jgi:alpha-glucosidase
LGTSPGGVIYQIYVRSFADSDGDGVGDLRGILAKLDHLEWLGVDAIWLSPIHPSPDDDWGYDVADYFGVHPQLGRPGDLDELIAAAGRRGIGVILDLVPNHTSDRHPWFVDGRSSRDSAHRDWYVWADGRRDGMPPNNWVSSFGGPAWSYDEATRQWYLHHFLSSQPDLNWWNPSVRDAFDAILRHWFDRGAAGLRIDVCHMIVKDRELRDNPPATDDDPAFLRLLGQRQTFDSGLPELHEVLRHWRRIADEYAPPRMLLGETYVFDLDQLASYYGAGDELSLAFNMPFLFAPFEAEALRKIIADTEARLGSDHWPVWTMSNHDVSRFATRWCQGDARKARCALLLLLALRGTAVLYYGDEIGIQDAPIPFAELRDPVGKRFWPSVPGRDPARTPLPWNASAGAGFTSAKTPWLRIGEDRSRNVAAQRDDAASELHLCRDLIALRRAHEELRHGDSAAVPSPPGVLAWRRGGRFLVAVNLTDVPSSLSTTQGRVRIGTDRNRDGQVANGMLSLQPWEGVVMDASLR